MRHHRKEKKFGRSTEHRKAMFRNQLNSLIDLEQIRTTDAKAKELRRHADRIITLGKQGIGADKATLYTLRERAFARLRSRDTVRKLFDTLAPRFKERAGGYTRIIKIGRRAGDNAAMSVIEFLPAEVAGGAKKKAPKRRSTGAAKEKAAPKAKKPSTKKEAAVEKTE